MKRRNIVCGGKEELSRKMRKKLEKENIFVEDKRKGEGK